MSGEGGDGDVRGGCGDGEEGVVMGGGCGDGEEGVVMGRRVW